jgi:ketosteroid isomerase-like protein
VADEHERWESMSRGQFRELQQGQRLRERRGRTWTVTGAAREVDGYAMVMVRSGDLVRRLDEHFADDYMLLPATGPE